MIRFFIYFYYFFKDYNRNENVFNQKVNSFIAVIGIILINILTIWNYSSTFLDVLNLSDLVTFNYGYLTNKLISALIVSPILFLVLIYYKFNKFKIDEVLRSFEQESNVERRKNRLKVWVYFISSLILLFSSFFIQLIK